MIKFQQASCLVLFLLTNHQAFAQQTQRAPIFSQLISSANQELILLQELRIQAPVSKVWQAYTTDDGWKSWASPVVKIDLRNGGSIKTHYVEGAKIGDAGTNTLNIINYVPERVLTLQAELSINWPDIMQEDAENLMNVIIFESIDESTTKIMSYGVGYKDTSAYRDLMAFFIPANESLLEKLRKNLEN
jgi:uncharacterized protein YndB with AHSA1/START domain